MLLDFRQISGETSKNIFGVKDFRLQLICPVGKNVLPLAYIWDSFHFLLLKNRSIL